MSSPKLTHTRTIVLFVLSMSLLIVFLAQPELVSGKGERFNALSSQPPESLSIRSSETPALFAAQLAEQPLSQLSFENLLVTQYRQRFPLWSDRAFPELIRPLSASARTMPVTFAAPAACTNNNYTITPKSNDTIYVDCPAQTSSYIAYQITNNTGANVADLWVKLTGSANILLNEDGLYHVGALANGASTTVYFYINVSPCADYNTAQNLSVSIFTAPPAPIGSASSVASCSFGYKVVDGLAANSNKITTVTNAPNPPNIGGCLTIEVRGFTGNVGDDGIFAPTAASLPGWPADTYKLIDTTITFYNSPSNEGGCDFSGAPTSTYNDTLIVDPPLAKDSVYCYKIDYKFIIEQIETTSTPVSPSTWISSGNPTKHNDTITPTPSPIPTPINTTTLSKTASPTNVSSGSTVTYTVTATNTGSGDVFLNSFKDVLPTGFTYVTSTSLFNGGAIPDPTISSQTLTWNGVFTIPAGGSRTLVYQATAPTFSGCATFQNSAVAFVGIGAGAIQIDTTLATNDNKPAVATVTGGTDSTPPVITCPTGPVTANAATGTCAANVSFTVTATDECSTPDVVCAPASGSSFPVGTTQVTCTATDATGNTASCSFNVVVADAEAPTITCPTGPITANAAQGTCAANVSFTVTAMDNCTTTPTISCTANGQPVSSGASFPVGSTTVTCKAADAAGNMTSECSFTVTVSDTQAPTLSCPANITTSNDTGVCNAAVSYTVPTGSDNCDTSVTVNCVPAPGSTFSLGTTTVTCTATDDANNSQQCTFTVTVNDTEKPTLTCPVNITASNDAGVCTTVVSYTTPTGSDNCDTSVTVNCVPASGSTFSVGTTTVTCTATDDANNSQQCTFTVTVNDTEKPTLTCPANITTSNDPGVCNAAVSYTVPTGIDNCDTSVTVNCLPAPGSTFSLGTTTVTCTATDDANNSQQCSFTVTVNDTEKPTLTCPANITTSNDAGVCNAVVGYTVPTGSDNCDTSVTVNCVPAPGSTFSLGTTTVICTATDDANNSQQCTFTVTVNDTEKPTLACPANITTSNAPGACNAVVSYTAPTGSDNCDTSVTVNCVPAPSSTFSLGTTTVTCTATDDANNSQQCTFTVTVNDTEKPTLNCPADIVTNVTKKDCTAVVNYTTPAASDNCDTSVAVSCVPASGSTFNVGTTTVTCTATDDVGNTQECTFEVTINPCADLTITKTNDTNRVSTGGTTTYLIVIANNGPGAADGAVFTDPPVVGLNVTSVTCEIAAGGAVCPAVGDVTVAAMQGAGIVIPVLPAGGSVTFAVTGTITAAGGEITNTAIVAPPAGVTDPITPNTASDTDPLSNSLTVSDQRAGSLLFFPIYTSHIANPGAENTRINITNTHETESAALHLFFVDGETCSVADNYACLTPNQTTSFLASDVDPGVIGYIIAVVVDPRTGCPINFNFLTGDEYVKFQSGHAANLGAEAFPALADIPAVCDERSQTAELAFDGLHYANAPRVLALSNIASPVENNSTMLILNRLGGDLRSNAAGIGSLFGILFDQLENPYSFTASGGCQLKRLLDNNFPRTSPRLGTAIPAQSSGWMKLWAVEDYGLLGAMLNFNPNAANSPNAYNQGHNLHKLTFTTKAKLTIPVFAPNCR